MNVTSITFWVALLLCGVILAESQLLSADDYYQSGLVLYQDEQYEVAIEALKQAVQIEPSSALYHYQLGSAYGRLAEQSGWIKAYQLAKKTLNHLRLASQLEPSNIDYIEALKQYYQTAPRFLGGNKDKAKQLEKQISILSDG